MLAKSTATPPIVSASTLVIAAVSEVLPWSTWPMVPMFRCGLFRSNFAFAIFLPSDSNSVPHQGPRERGPLAGVVS